MYWGVFTQWNPTPATKMNTLQRQTTTWMNFKTAMLNKRRQTHTKKLCITLFKVLKAKLIYGIISQNGGYLWGEWKG